MKSIEEIREELDEIKVDREYCLMDSFLPIDRFGYEQELDEINYLRQLNDDALISYVKEKAMSNMTSEFDYKWFWKFINEQ